MRSLFIIFCFITANLFASSKDQIDQLQTQIYSVLESDLDSAFELTKYSLELSSDVDYDWGLANSYFLQGYIYWQKDILSSSLLHYLKALKIFENLNEDRAVDASLKLYLNVGSLLRKHYKYNEAIYYYRKGIQFANANDRQLYKLRLLYNQAYAFEDQDDYTNATLVLDEATALAYELNNQEKILDCLNLRGVIYDNQNNFEAARNAFSRLLEVPFITLEYEAITYHNLGYSSMMDHLYDSAERYFNKALDLKRDIVDHELTFTTLRDLTDLYQRQGKLQLAASYGSKALQYYDQVRLDPSNFKIFKKLNQVNFKLNRPDQANIYSNKYFDESDKFIAHQQEILEINERFKMDLILSGFYFETEVDTQYRNYQMILMAVSIGFTILIGLSFLRFNYLKRKVSIGIRKIDEESNV